MGRKVVTYTAPEDCGRDAGKVYQITEMPASDGEWFAVRTLAALQRAGVDVGDAMDGGWQRLATAGIHAFAYIPPHDLRPLLGEMFATLKVRPDPRHPNVVRDLIEDDDIEEVRTRFLLRWEIFKLHANFSSAESPPNSATPGPTASQNSTSHAAPTSPPPSPPRSHPARPR